ncbi:homoserine kinase [Bacillus sp. DNRA2]|uniref:homoserine kinase n=1 Tax=Bacillus sp. DNRA2 TaxID=2723053 RepID=UPI00145F7FAD|nr:homoserine kinase [Bacillus sp. DNRA2]NMD69019.1 homoserine kinase [Bacillus sp. DNRA2]
MSEDGMFLIKVPGSSANLGPGFDSIGLAVSVYLTITAERSDTWEVIPESKELECFPSDDTNFICKIAIDTAAKFGKIMPPCRLRVASDIPLARGLGSSASAIVAGIELADCICELNLSRDQKLMIASEIEGHPDNVGPSIFGGLFIGYQTDTEVHKAVFADLNCDLVVVVPRVELLTKASRNVLPEQVAFAEAVKAGAVGNLLVAALLSGNFELAGKMMKADRYHQPYRRSLVPHMAVVEELAEKSGAFGAALSGAGPSILCFAPAGQGAALVQELNAALPDMDIIELQIDSCGSTTSLVEICEK